MGDGASTPPVPSPLSVEPPARSRVLVVEDDPAILELVRRLLHAKGYEVDCAESGDRALAQLASSRFDLVLSDINLPGLTGIELLRRARSLDPDLPVILVTAGPTLESAIEAVEHGAIRYLQKPLDLTGMLDAVRAAVRLGRLSRLESHALSLARLHRELAATPDLDARFEAAFEGIWVAFQPIVRWSTHRIEAYEALVRTRAEHLRAPPELFDAAETLGELTRLGRHIRRLAAETFVHAPASASLYLNLVGRDLLDEELFATDTALAAIADRVVLEVTERESLAAIPGLRERVAQLRRLGFRIAIDDLGAGYAGLETFASLEPDVVKLDMSLVRHIDRSPTKERLVRHLVEAAHDLRAVVVGEGVETRDEREALLTLGCDLLQGYHFARPGPPFPDAKADTVMPPRGLRVSSLPPGPLARAR